MEIKKLSAYGVSVELGKELVDFSQTEYEVIAVMNTAQGTEELHCTYMVGSDSGKSIVRKKQGIKFEGETHEGEKANVGDVEGLTPGISRCIRNMALHFARLSVQIAGNCRQS